MDKISYLSYLDQGDTLHIQLTAGTIYGGGEVAFSSFMSYLVSPESNNDVGVKSNQQKLKPVDEQDKPSNGLIHYR